MARFFFDQCDDDRVVRDQLGCEYDTILQARHGASAVLGQLAREAFHDRVSRALAIEVSDAERVPLFRVALRFEVQSPSEARRAFGLYENSP